MSRSQRNRNDEKKLKARQAKKGERHRSGAYLAAKTGRRERPTDTAHAGPTDSETNMLDSDSTMM